MHFFVRIKSFKTIIPLRVPGLLHFPLTVKLTKNKSWDPETSTSSNKEARETFMICEADEMHLNVEPNLFCAMDFPGAMLAVPLTLRLSREIPFLLLVSS